MRTHPRSRNLLPNARDLPAPLKSTCALQCHPPTGSELSHRYEETDDGVTVRFSSREGGEETAYSAKLLIGADGGFSGVRQQCLNDGLPKSPVSILLNS